MKRDIQSALDEVESTYQELSTIAKEMTESVFEDLNKIIDTFNNDIYKLNLDILREYILKLSMISFSISEIKDKASLKQECAEAIKKETYANKFTCSDGSVAVRENNALLQSSEQIVVELVYKLVENLFKSRLDETHRLIDVLKTVIMSRMQEMKLANTMSIGDTQ